MWTLFQAFIAVEKSYFESIDEQLAARTTLQLQLPEVRLYKYICIVLTVVVYLQLILTNCVRIIRKIAVTFHTCYVLVCPG